MSTIEDLLWSSASGLLGPAPELDPFTDDDALQEVQLLDLRVHALSSTAALLLELRTALHFEDGNAAALVVRRVNSVIWKGVESETDKTAWTIVGSATRRVGKFLTLECSFSPHASIQVSGKRAEFYVLDIPRIGDVPPDYCEDTESRIRDKLPRWDSSFSILHASSLRMDAS